MQNEVLITVITSAPRQVLHLRAARAARLFASSLRPRRQFMVLLSTLVFAVASGAAEGGGAQASPVRASVHNKNNAAPNAAQFREVKAFIQNLIHEEGVPSVTVAVAKDGEIVWEEGFGWADRERRVPATPHTPYSLASMTKPITATAVMALGEEGKIGIDDPIEQHLGRLKLTGLAGDTKGVTPRRIMAHSSGLPFHYWFHHAGYLPPNAEETLTRYGVVVYPPGAQFQYSNIGYRALDVAVANASGQAFADFLRQRIFVPLRMTRSALGQHSAWASEAATRYDGKQNAIPFYMTDTPGSGDVWSSAHDMLRFAAFHLGTPLPGQQPVLKPDSVRAMQRLSSAPGALDLWGLGWALKTDGGYRLVWHGGNQPGVFNEMRLYPEERLAIVVMSNQENDKVTKVADKIAAVMLPRYNDQQAAQDDDHSLAAVQARSNPLPKLSGKWSGTVTTYSGTLPLTLDFEADGDVKVKLGSQYTTLVNNIGMFGNLMMGRFFGTMPTSDARKHRHVLLLLVRPQGEELVGQLVAQTLTDPDIYALSSFVRLKQEPQAGAS